MRSRIPLEKKKKALLISKLLDKEALRSTLRWFGHIERMENEEFVKKVYRRSVEGPKRRGRPLGRWKDKVMEYVSERRARGNGLEWARRECMDREKWRSVCCSHSLGGRFQRE